MGLDWPSRRFRKRFLLPLLSVLILLCPSLAGVASAGVNTWTTNGPAGGDIRALAIDFANPATLYAGASGGGVIKSTNGGGNWTVINSGLTSTDVRSLAIDPANPATLYAGTSGGVFRSRPQGRPLSDGVSWTAINTGLTSIDVRALAVGPGNPATVYAGTSGGVFQSTNGGGSWTAINTGLTSTDVLALAINRWNPVMLYAGTSGGVYRNDGVSWTPINAGLTNISVSALAIDPGGFWDYGGDTLYAGTSGGAYRNDGVSWTAINAGLTNTVVQALAIPYPPSGAGPDTAYAGTEGGVFKIATNGGGSWTAINTGLTNPNVLALAIDPANPATLYAGTSSGGIFKSTNGGESWITTGPAKAADFYTLTPCRVVDTRGASGPYGGPSLVTGADRTFVFAGQCGIPSTATAVVLNVVAVSPTSGPGFLTLYPGGTARPPTSTINYNAGKIRANNAIIPLGALLDINVYCLQSSGTTDMVIDVNGYFQ